MTDAVFQQLCEWVRGVLGDEIAISADPPQDAPEASFISIYLKDIEPSPSTGVRPVGNRLQLILSYLITANAQNVHDINRHIVTLAFSAMPTANLAPVFASLSAEEWRAFGVTPRPALLFKIPVNYEFDVAAVKRVEYPMVIKMVSSVQQDEAAQARKSVGKAGA